MGVLRAPEEGFWFRGLHTVQETLRGVVRGTQTKSISSLRALSYGGVHVGERRVLAGTSVPRESRSRIHFGSLRPVTFGSVRRGQDTPDPRLPVYDGSLTEVRRTWVESPGSS